MVLSSMNAADSTHALTITVKANNRDIDVQIIFLGISLMGIDMGHKTKRLLRDWRICD